MKLYIIVFSYRSSFYEHIIVGIFIDRIGKQEKCWIDFYRKLFSVINILFHDRKITRLLNGAEMNFIEF